MKLQGWTAMIIPGVVIGAGLASVRAQTPDELLQRSLAKLRAPELKIAYALHPEVCSIRKEDRRWIVSCEGVPIHFYRRYTLCDPGPPKECRPVPTTFTNCRSFYWYTPIHR
jgi:hypothetical protein